MMDVKAVLIDGYTDDPAALGVPPYISPVSRAVAGAILDAGSEVEYITIDKIRRGYRIPISKISVLISGSTVPGKYIRSMPMSLKEIGEMLPFFKGRKLIGGAAAFSPIANEFDFAAKNDPAALVYDILTEKKITDRFRTLDEWNRWMILGASIVTQHQDYPCPLIAEIETYRGCHRYISGGCSYCTEPLKGKPLMRSPKDILMEAEKLKKFGVRNIRVGGQTCIISYGSKDNSDTPRPNPNAIYELFQGLQKLNFDVLHVDNANPAVISKYPEESKEILDTLVKYCTSGNVLALGMESADMRVIKENNLNSTPNQVLTAIRIINEVGREVGETGMPRLLPGINFIVGLDGESKETYYMNKEFLQKLVNENLKVRRINIRQVLPVRRNFDTKINLSFFKKYKHDIRTTIDHNMLQTIVPKGTILRKVFMEINHGNITFGRQIGSYPLLVGIPYHLKCGRFYDIKITDWGFRSVTGVEYPFRINHEIMSAIASLPGIGKKRAASIIRNRPYHSLDELSRVIGDKEITANLRDFTSFE
ncbi:MAG: radical SAM protein [archaeon]|nr:radical SAM protein [archaeon]